MSKLLRLSNVVASSTITYSLVGFGCGIAGIHLTIHTFFLEKYAELFQLYKHGFEVNVPEEFEHMLPDISDDLRIPIHKPTTKLFTMIGFDTTHFGSIQSDCGSIIGIPASFLYKTKDDIDHASIQVGYKSVPWDSKEGLLLEESLILSDKAKRYGIAYELALANTYKLFFHILCAPVSIGICTYVNNYFCDLFGLPYRPMRIKGLFFSLLSIFGVGLYFTLKDMATQYCELSAHDKVCEGGEQYIVGGLEFYEKLLLKHKALRSLLSDGKSDYTMNGDPIYLFRRKHIPPTTLKSLTEQKFNELKQKNPS